MGVFDKHGKDGMNIGVFFLTLSESGLSISQCGSSGDFVYAKLCVVRVRNYLRFSAATFHCIEAVCREQNEVLSRMTRSVSGLR